MPRCSNCETELPEDHRGPCPKCGAKDQTIGAPVAEVVVKVPDVTVWLSQTSAPAWLEDARAEAERGQELAEELDQEHSPATQQALVRSLHREIVFAVCFAEAFLLEYLRDYVFIHRPGKGHREALVAFVEREKDDRGIPLWERLGIRDRWKWAVETLQDEGKIRAEPAFEGQAWQEFQEDLAPFRNGIVHAKISRPIRGGTEESTGPTPATLFDRGPGWATSVVTELARDLHELNPRDMDPPEYLE